MPKYEVTLEWMFKGSVQLDAADEEQATRRAFHALEWDQFSPAQDWPDRAVSVVEVKNGETDA